MVGAVAAVGYRRRRMNQGFVEPAEGAQDYAVPVSHVQCTSNPTQRL